MRIGPNLSTLGALQQSQAKLQGSLSRLSSGKRVTSASSDPAALAMSERLTSQISAISQGQKQISTASSALTIASSGLDSQMQDLQRMREIAVQASNGALSSEDRASLQEEFESLSDEVGRVADQTKFGDQKLLDGSFDKSLSTGQGSRQISIGSTSLTSLGLQAEGISTEESAEDALAAIDRAITQVNREASHIGAQQNALENSQQALSVAKENISSARSSLIDLDYASEVGEQAKINLEMRAQISALKKEQQTQKDLLELLTKKK